MSYEESKDRKNDFEHELRKKNTLIIVIWAQHSVEVGFWQPQMVEGVSRGKNGHLYRCAR